MPSSFDTSQLGPNEVADEDWVLLDIPGAPNEYETAHSSPSSSTLLTTLRGQPVRISEGIPPSSTLNKSQIDVFGGGSELNINRSLPDTPRIRYQIGPNSTGTFDFKKVTHTSGDPTWLARLFNPEYETSSETMELLVKGLLGSSPQYTYNPIQIIDISKINLTTAEDDDRERRLSIWRKLAKAYDTQLDDIITYADKEVQEWLWNNNYNKLRAHTRLALTKLRGIVETAHKEGNLDLGKYFRPYLPLMEPSSVYAAAKACSGTAAAELKKARDIGSGLAVGYGKRILASAWRPATTSGTTVSD